MDYTYTETNDDEYAGVRHTRVGFVEDVNRGKGVAKLDF